MLGHALLVASASTGLAPIVFSGTLSANGTSGVVTSATVTVTVPASNTGVITFNNYIDVGVITTTQYSRNGGAFTTITDGSDTVAFSDGDTLAVRTNSVGSGESRTFDTVDSTTAGVIETVLQNYT